MIDAKAAKDSIEEIAKCSTFPISIVFVGVGNDKYPVGNSPDSIFSRIFEQKLKTTDNLVQQRENVNFIDTTDETELPLLNNKIFSIISRQMVLHEFKQSK